MTDTIESALTPAQITRNQFIQGLRSFADAIEANPELPMPLTNSLNFTFYASDEKQVRLVLALLEAPQIEIRPHETARYRAQIEGRVDGVTVRLVADPAWVCEKVSSRMVEQTEWAFNGQVVEVKP